MNTEAKRIVVLGGGYGGIMAALRLAGKTKRLNTTITLVNGLAHFVERPRLHEQATGTNLNNWPISQFTRGTNIRFVQGWASAINPAQHSVSVKTSHGEKPLAYDYLIVALGSRVNRQTVPGAAQYAFSLDPYGNLTTANLQNKLVAFSDKPFKVAVIGGGATGIEAATQIKGKYPHSEVALVTQGEAGAFKGAQVQKHIRQALVEQNIVIHEHCAVSQIKADKVICHSKQIPAEVIIWAGGFIASPLGREAGLKVNAQNQILVDPYLRSLSQPNIYAIGDAAYPQQEPGAPMRMSLFTALVSGAQAAENIIAEIKGKPLKPLSYAWYGQGIALGPHDAVGFATYPADIAWKLILRRKLAVKMRNFFVWYLGQVLFLERRIPGFFFWNGKKRYARQKNKRNKSLTSFRMRP